MIAAVTTKPTRISPEMVGTALLRAEQSRNHLQHALSAATPVEALVLLPMIAQAAELVNAISTLRAAVSE